jgi:formylglycine-generating enzyme required for sulfatase activity
MKTRLWTITIAVLALLPILVFTGASRSSSESLSILLENSVGSYESVKIYRSMHLLLIGVSRYPAESGIDDLAYPVPDMELIRRTMSDSYTISGITTLYNDKATRSNILETIRRLNDTRWNYDDGLMIVFAGQSTSGEYDGNSSSGYLLPFDGSLVEAEMDRNINIAWFRDNVIKKLEPKHILTLYITDLYDYGYENLSGGYKKTDFEFVQANRSEPVIYSLSAGDGRGEIAVDDSRNQSYFTQFMCTILADQTEFITGKNLFRTIVDRADEQAVTIDMQISYDYGEGDLLFIYGDRKDPRETIENARKRISSIKRDIDKLEKKIARFKDRDNDKYNELFLQKNNLENEMLQLQQRVDKLSEIYGNQKERESEASRNNNPNDEINELKLLDRLAKRKLSANDIYISDVLREARKLHGAIRQQEATFEESRKEYSKSVTRYYDNLIEQVTNSEKGEFEKTFDYNARIQLELDNLEEQKKKNISSYTSEKETILSDFKNTLAEIMNEWYPYPAGSYRVKIGRYNADEEFFTVNVSFPRIGESFTTSLYIDIGTARKLGPVRNDITRILESGLIEVDNELVDEPHRLKIIDQTADIVLDEQIFVRKAKYQDFAKNRVEKERKNLSAGQADKLEELWNQKHADDTSEIEGGTFTMGSNSGEPDESPEHQVTVSSFLMGKYEVTYKQVSKVFNWAIQNELVSLERDSIILQGRKKRKLLDIGSKNSSLEFKSMKLYVKDGMEDYPCTEITWHGAVVFCNVLSDMEGLNPAYDLSTWECSFNTNGYRLPTEAEWEYAAKGGLMTDGYSFSGSDDLDEIAWYYYNSENTTHPVGMKEPNQLDLYDMTGNVWEWCHDGKQSYNADSATDPFGNPGSDARIIRGGSFSRDSASYRNSDREASLSYISSGKTGFRIVRRRSLSTGN